MISHNTPTKAASRNLRTTAPTLIARPVARAALSRVMEWATDGLSDHMSHEDAGRELGLTSRAFAA